MAAPSSSAWASSAARLLGLLVALAAQASTARFEVLDVVVLQLGGLFEMERLVALVVVGRLHAVAVGHGVVVLGRVDQGVGRFGAQLRRGRASSNQPSGSRGSQRYSASWAAVSTCSFGRSVRRVW